MLISDCEREFVVLTERQRRREERSGRERREELYWVSMVIEKLITRCVREKGR